MNKDNKNTEHNDTEHNDTEHNDTDKKLHISDVVGSNLMKLPDGGKVVIINHGLIPNGNYIFFKGSSGDYFVTLSYQDRHSTYRISETTLKKYLS